MQDQLTADEVSPAAGIAAPKFKEVHGAFMFAGPAATGNLLPRVVDQHESPRRDQWVHEPVLSADEAVLVSDPAITSLDTQGAARILAAAIKKIDGVDLVVFGRQTLDDGSGITGAQTARALGWPLLSLAGQIKIQDGKIQVERVIEEGRQTMSASLPAVISVVQSIGEPRYPSFMGIRKASKAQIPAWSLADLGMEAPAPVVTRAEIMTPPVSSAACEIITGESPQAIAEALVDKIMAEKVL